MADQIIALTKEEIEIIRDWYHASAGESAHHRDATLFALLEKLGFSAHRRDLCLSDPSHFVEDHRSTIIAYNEAIKLYRRRHPKDEEVIAANEAQSIG